MVTEPAGQEPRDNNHDQARKSFRCYESVGLIVMDPRIGTMSTVRLRVHVGQSWDDVLLMYDLRGNRMVEICLHRPTLMVAYGSMGRGEVCKELGGERSGKKHVFFPVRQKEGNAGCRLRFRLPMADRDLIEECINQQ